MRLHIPLFMLSQSAGDHDFKKGDRVVCKIAKNEWYTGTITRAGAKLHVDFDDDFDAIIESKDFKHVKLMVKAKKLKRALTDLEAKAFYEQKKTLKEALKKPTTPLKKEESKKPALIKKPTPIVKPVSKPTPAPTPVKPVTPIKVAPSPIKVQEPVKPLEPRAYKNDWTIEINGLNERSWKFVIKDDATAPSFKYAASSMSATPQEALKFALLELKVPNASFTLKYTPPKATENADGKLISTHTLENLNAENATEKLGTLIKQLVPAPDLKKPIAAPPKAPINQPAPTTKSDDAWQLYLIPNDEGKWSFGSKNRLVNATQFHNSDFKYDTALDAFYASQLWKQLNTFTLRIAEETMGNAITRAAVFENMNYLSAERVIQNYEDKQEQEKHESGWHIYVQLAGPRMNPYWTYQTTNYDKRKYPDENNLPLYARAMTPHIKGTNTIDKAVEYGIDDLPYSEANRPFTLHWKRGTETLVFEKVTADNYKTILNKQRKQDMEDALKAGPETEHAEGEAPYLLVGDSVDYAKAARGSDHAKLTYMMKVWTRANRALFGGRLLPCHLDFIKEQSADRFRLRGQWNPSTRKLRVSRRKFNTNEEKFLDTFVHEMCHQAVTDIDRSNDRTDGGHGPAWIRWMQKVGIPPSRYDLTHNSEYMSDEEKENYEKRTEARKEQIADKRELPNTIALGTPMQFYQSSEFRWIKGVAIGILGSKFYMVEKTTGGHWWLGNKGKGNIFALDPSDARDFSSPEWKQAAQREKDNLELHAEIKRRRRQMKKYSIGY